MGAARFVGRVGGLAVALGVGAAAFYGQGVAWADAPSSEAGAGATGTKDSAQSSSASHGRRTSVKAAAKDTQSQRNSDSEAPSGASAARQATTPDVPESSADIPAVDEIVAPDTAVTDPGPAEPVAVALDAQIDTVVPQIIVDPLPEPLPAPVDGVTDFLVAADNALADGAGSDPQVPVDSPLAWSLLAVARRNTLGAASAANVSAAQTASAQVTQGGITYNPTVEYVDGIIQGTLNATSASGATLTYQSLGGSLGGKLDIGTVPETADTTDPQSYTILPYANWLDAGQTKGTETFGVRISESTQFDQFLANIPLIGLVANPVIGLLQKLPLIGDLLAPIIGSSIVAQIAVDVADLAPGDDPLAFTYKVTSFDGTLISTNFFPASGLAPGATADTVFNGPGLGAAGATDPYAISGTAGLVPGLAILRGPSQLGAGYNVVTWDPRGEYASGGILQLDNPMYEGRDVSSLITWAANNTPANLTDVDDPAMGMVGGSYGGGIQLATVDPRIDAVVPGIAWNSLNESLYPGTTFKTAWANTLGLALLTAGARVNTQIWEGILSGDLFGWISQSAQAVLGSSGPGPLLSTLGAPALFVQGIVDALFPLVQSSENAQTILETNPILDPEQVKMIWFCGGHGVCLDPVNPTQYQTIYGNTIAWLKKYVSDAPIPIDLIVPNFQWWDQNGDYFSSPLRPFQQGFNQADPLVGQSDGGGLGILPFAIGGS
ncbi:MAG: CocE/NonD family hydrolase, partial [Mycobacterium sp.]